MDATSLDWLCPLSRHHLRRSRGGSQHPRCHVSLPTQSAGGGDVAVELGIGASLRGSSPGDRDVLPSHYAVSVSDLFHGTDGLENEKGISLASLDRGSAPRGCRTCQRVFVNGNCAHRRRGRVSGTSSPWPPALSGFSRRGRSRDRLRP